jgi:hypothetical protein
MKNNTKSKTGRNWPSRDLASRCLSWRAILFIKKSSGFIYTRMLEAIFGREIRLEPYNDCQRAGAIVCVASNVTHSGVAADSSLVPFPLSFIHPLNLQSSHFALSCFLL